MSRHSPTFIPKRLTDGPWDDEANHPFTLNYLTAPAAVQRFVNSSVINQIWPETLNPAAAELESFFTVRQTRYLSETVGSNKLAELDLYLRHSRLRIPVLEVLGSDALAGVDCRASRKGFCNAADSKSCRTCSRERWRSETSPERFNCWRTRKVAAPSVLMTHFCWHIYIA